MGSIPTYSRQREPERQGCSGFCAFQPLSQTFGLPAPRPGSLLVQHSFIYEHGDGFPSPHLHNLLRSPAAGRISHGAAIFHIAQAVIIRRTGDIQLIPNVN